jgi:hypothetical protein
MTLIDAQQSFSPAHGTGPYCEYAPNDKSDPCFAEAMRHQRRQVKILLFSMAVASATGAALGFIVKNEVGF